MFLYISLIFADDVNVNSICGSDDRVPSGYSAIGRMGKLNTLKGGCTATLVGRRCVITAGHCRGFHFVEFNVPKSHNGEIVRSADEDQYRIKKKYVSVWKSTPSQADWQDFAVYSLRQNSRTKKWPGDVQGSLQISKQRPVVGNRVRVSGYGVDSEPTKNKAQQTDVGELLEYAGALRYSLDTTGGASGSTVIDELSGKIIGVHTNGGCLEGPGNFGTEILAHANFQKAINRCLADEADLSR